MDTPRSLAALFVAAATAQAPPFRINEHSGDIDLKVVVVGSDAKAVKAEFLRLHEWLPFEAKTRLESISTPNLPAAGASLSFQAIIPSLSPIEGRTIRWNVFGATAPISGPNSVIHSLHLREAACVVLLPGDEAAMTQSLPALLERAEVHLEATVMVAVAAKDRPLSYPKDWGVVPASSTAEAFQQSAAELHRRLVALRTIPPKR